MRKLTLAVLCFFSNLAFAESGDVRKEVIELKTNILSNKPEFNESYYKHRLAVIETKLLKKVVVYEILNYLASEGSKRKKSLIRDVVDVSLDSSFVFVDMGDDHIERFTRFLEWGYGETNFLNLVSRWKKGQYIKKLNVTLTYSSIDYGVWQINDLHDWSLVPTFNKLYSSGVINFKVKHVKKMNDFMDVPTNLPMRCIVETERKSLGWNWKHANEPKFRSFIEEKIRELEKEGLYDRALVEKYYHLVPIKTYSLEK